MVAGIDIDDVDRIAQRNAQPLALADGEMLMAFVRADDRAVGRDEFAGAKRFRAATAHQRGIILVRNEADFLRVRLVEHRQLPFLGHRAHFMLFEAADRQQRVIQRVARSCQTGRSSGPCDDRARAAAAVAPVIGSTSARA